MTDSTTPASGPTSEWRQEGEGPHPTLAGNRFDPNVSGSGTHQEGIDHIKSQSGVDNNTSSGLTGTTSNTSNQGGLMGTMKNYLGYGSGQSTTDARDETTSSGLTGGAGSGNTTADPLDSSRTTDPVSSDTTHGSMAGLNAEQKDPLSRQGAPRDTVGPPSSTPDDPSTGGRPSEPSADRTPSTKEEIGENMEGGTNRDGREGSSAREVEKDGERSQHAKDELSKPAAETGSKRNNEDAIPTAGGERLGQKHWGESKIVPDNPKPEGESGVASKDGQPTDQVRDNTNANTGGAKAPHEHSEKGEGKEKLTDKIKHTLHIGGNKE